MWLRRRYLVLAAFFLFLFSLFGLYIYIKIPEPIRVEDALQMVPENRWPVVEDDLDLQSLRLALDRNLVYLNKLAKKRKFN